MKKLSCGFLAIGTIAPSGWAPACPLGGSRPVHDRRHDSGRAGRPPAHVPRRRRQRHHPALRADAGRDDVDACRTIPSASWTRRSRCANCFSPVQSSYPRRGRKGPGPEPFGRAGLPRSRAKPRPASTRPASLCLSWPGNCRPRCCASAPPPGRRPALCGAAMRIVSSARRLWGCSASPTASAACPAGPRPRRRPATPSCSPPSGPWRAARRPTWRLIMTARHHEVSVEAGQRYPPRHRHHPHLRLHPGGGIPPGSCGRLAGLRVGKWLSGPADRGSQCRERGAAEGRPGRVRALYPGRRPRHHPLPGQSLPPRAGVDQPPAGGRQPVSVLHRRGHRAWSPTSRIGGYYSGRRSRTRRRRFCTI